MSRTLRFNAPAHHVLRPEGPEGPEVYGGKTFTCSDERAEEHLTSPYYDVSEADDLAKRSRAELDELATERGLDPKAYGTKAALIEAIEAIEVTQTESGADAGEEPEGGEGHAETND